LGRATLPKPALGEHFSTSPPAACQHLSECMPARLLHKESGSV
jgi:hypothetical protein